MGDIELNMDEIVNIAKRCVLYCNGESTMDNIVKETDKMIIIVVIVI